MRVKNGPDFICVGMPKCGTGWLFDQLDTHPDFWMPPVKELLYLNQPIPQLRFLGERSRTAVARARQTPGRTLGERVLRRELVDARDIGFVQYAESIKGTPRDMSRYAGLFRFKGKLLSGDITPPYWMLSEETIKSISDYFPHTKILLLVRDPVARAWSRISVFHRSGKFNADILEDTAQFASFLQRSRKAGRLHATALAQTWLKYVPKKNLRVFLFDDIAEKPEKVRRDVLIHLGADPSKKSAHLAADYNRKSGYRKLSLSEAAKAVLAEHFKDELFACAALFGGSAREWPARYGFKKSRSRKIPAA